MSDTDIRKYMEAKALISSLEEKAERYRKRILDHMTKEGMTAMKTDDYTAKIRVMRSEHVYKKDVPNEVWNRYKRESEFTQLVVTQNKNKAISKSP